MTMSMSQEKLEDRNVLSENSFSLQQVFHLYVFIEHTGTTELLTSHFVELFTFSCTQKRHHEQVARRK